MPPRPASVEGLHGVTRRRRRFYKGRITNVHDDGAVDVLYNDGDLRCVRTGQNFYSVNVRMI